MPDALIAMTGFNRVGKTTLAKHLMKQLQDMGVGTVYRPFGDKLKEELHYSGIYREYLDQKSSKARAVLRAYGDAKREINPLHYVNAWKEHVTTWYNVSKPRVCVIVDDMYHWNELRGVLEFSDVNKLTPIVIAVERAGTSPTYEERLRFDSVRESAEIMSYIAPDAWVVEPRPDVANLNSFIDYVPLETVPSAEMRQAIFGDHGSTKVVYVYNSSRYEAAKGTTDEDYKTYVDDLYDLYIPRIMNLL